jgi:hypothetical protein
VMTDWAKLAEPFDPSEVKQRPGRGGMTFSYVDARAVMQRLDDVLGPEGWDFQSSVIPGTDIVHGKLTIGGNIREDYGYPNSDQDDEPVKAASSDALKRCAVMFGIGRHLYTDNTSHRIPSGAPAGQRTSSPSPARPARSTTDVPEMAPNDWDEPTPIRAESDNSDCPIHNVPWLGTWGDLYHGPKGIVDGGYCRHPENTRQEGRRPAGARR